MKPKPVSSLGLSALAEMHDADRARGIDPFAVERGPEPPPQPAPAWPRELVIEPADWDAERIEAEARKREARVREAAELLETVEPQPAPPAPMKRRRPW